MFPTLSSHKIRGGDLENKMPMHSVDISEFSITHILREINYAQQGCRIPGSGGAQAPPVFGTLSHKNAIKPENLRF